MGHETCPVIRNYERSKNIKNVFTGFMENDASLVGAGVKVAQDHLYVISDLRLH